MPDPVMDSLRRQRRTTDVEVIRHAQAREECQKERRGAARSATDRDRRTPPAVCQVGCTVRAQGSSPVTAALPRRPGSTAVATFARSEHRAVVTENLADSAPEPDLVLVGVLKRKLPSDGAQARALAELLDRWTVENPDP